MVFSDEFSELKPYSELEPEFINTESSDVHSRILVVPIILVLKI